jgi:hypothetical protein
VYLLRNIITDTSSLKIVGNSQATQDLGSHTYVTEVIPDRVLPTGVQ